MKEMIYSAKRLNPPERIAEGEYKGFTYYVLNLGTHPCAYVDVTDTIWHGKDYCNIDIECHCGLTYASEHLATIEKKGWFIGWDYAHYCDFAGYELDLPYSLHSHGKMWTTKEIVAECKAVIDQLEKKGADNEQTMSREKQRELEEINRPKNEELFNNLEKQYQEVFKVKAESDEIDELTTVLYEASVLDYRWLATEAYNAGYRKQKSVGEWEIVKGSNGKEKMVCTNCRHGQDLHSTFTYCPNCGARMHGAKRKGGAE